MLQKTVVIQQHDAGIARYRLNDNAGDLTLVPGKEILHRIDVVKRRSQCQFGIIGRDASGVRLSKGGGSGTGFDKKAVGMAVIATVEFNKFVAAGKTPRQTQGAHGCFRSRVYKADYIDGWHHINDQLCQLNLQFAWCAEAHAPFSGFLHTLDHIGVGVTKNHRPPGTNIIDVFVMIDIPDAGAAGPGEETRCAANRFEGANR